MKKSSNLQILTDWFSEKKFNSDSQISNYSIIQSESEKKALNLFHQAAATIPAYQDFLKKNNCDFHKIKNISDFNNVPITTKENYIDVYDMKDRCWNGEITNMHMISTSSGTTGNPHFWPRNLQSEVDGALAHEFLFEYVCQIRNKKTLLINGFAMGNWIAGTFTLACANLLAWKGFPLTIMTPGYNSPEILTVIKNLASEFEKIVITGHTPFLKDLIEEGIELGIDWSNLDLTFLGTGQGISENWRDYVLKLIKSNNNTSFINLYGSADASLMGFETAQSISVRKLLNQDMKFSKDIFNDERLPSIYNFDPRLTFFESVDNELIITKNSGSPLIRYNIHDRGGVFNSGDLMNKLNLSNQIPTDLKLPFVYLFGREKFMVKIYGANIYTEHVQSVLNHPTLQPHISGNFLMEIAEDANKNPVLICRVELGPKAQESKQLSKMIQEIFISEVAKLNSEYSFLLGELKDKVHPQVLLYAHKDQKYFTEGAVKKTA